jgi:hypothetical protein
MATFHIPPQLRKSSGEKRQVEVEGATLREVLNAIEQAHPGILEKILDGDYLRPGLALAIDSAVMPPGLHHAVYPESVIHIVWAPSGG